MTVPVVSVKQGKLKGIIGNDIKGGEFFKFLGIPYAKPPLGNLRFKAPQPPESWDDVRDATKDGSPCFALVPDGSGTFEGAEDCLILNVYTKTIPNSTNSLKPVMVFFHGGGFIIGSSKSTFVGPEVLLSEDIVLVTINYRLGFLGFLSIDDISLEVPGNAGLKDQNMALKWVQQNIHHFNGDPNNVTLFGNSAGGASVHFHMLSKASRGLFHKAVLQSGCALNPWAYGFTDVKNIAKKLGYHAESDKEALDILLNTPLEKLHKTQMEYEDSLFAGFKRPIGPVIEKPNPTAFITEDPIKIIQSGDYYHVPMIIGFSSREGMLIKVNEKLFGQKMDYPNIEQSIPWQMQINDKTEQQTLVKEIEDLYFQGANIDEENFLYLGDTMFVLGLIQTIKLHLKTTKSPIYCYRLTASTNLNFLKTLEPDIKKFKGACHADEVGYLFKTHPNFHIVKDSKEEEILTAIVKFWTNFATYGNPTPEIESNIIWPSIEDENNIHFLDIDDEISVEVNPELKRMRFWELLLEKHPFVTRY